jgi:hypothetical protein
MTLTPPHSEHAHAGTAAHAAGLPALPKPVGRPKGDPSTIINVRLPLALLAQLDRYLDRLEGRTGLKANRGMITRRALEVFLATHAADDSLSATV